MPAQLNETATGQDQKAAYAALKDLRWKKTGFTFEAVDAPIGNRDIAQLVSHLSDLGFKRGDDYGINFEEGNPSVRILGEKALSALANNGVNYPGSSKHIDKTAGG